MQALKTAIKETMNPFDPSLDKTKLFRLTGGPALPDDIAHGLVNFMKTGREWCQEFEKECRENPARFEQRCENKIVKNFEGKIPMYEIMIIE